MRILRTILTLDPRYGGPVEGLKRSIEQHARSGHFTEVVCLDRPDSSFLAGLPFPAHALGPAWSRYGYTGRFSRWIVTNSHRFEAAVVHGLWNHSSVGGWQGLYAARLPYVVLAHGMMDPWFRDAYPLKHLAKQAFWLLAQGKVLRDADRVLFTSDEEMRLAQGVFWGFDYKAQVVAYGAADTPDRLIAQDEAFRQATKTLGARPYLLFLGRIHPKKGGDLLVEAFAGIANKHPGLDLVMAGPDQVGLRQALEAMAQRMGAADRIHWPGMLEGDAKWGALRGAAALVLPSHQENFGIVVAEALACGTPVLISNKVNTWREIEASRSGLVENDDLAGTRNLLTRFLAMSEAQRADMGVQARNCYVRSFDVAGAAQDLEAALTAAIGRGGLGMAKEEPEWAGQS